MTVYRTTKCPYCGFKLECFSMNAREQVGHPSNVCPRCKGIFKTGMEYWFEMSKSDKFSYLSGSYLLIIWTAFGIYTIAPFLLFCAFTGDFIFETPFLPLILGD